MRAFLLIVVAMLVAGCSPVPVAHQHGLAEPRAAALPEATVAPGPKSGNNMQICGGAGADVELHLSLVQQMYDKGLFHAALAHLDALGERGRALPEARYLRAESMRRIGKGTAAEEVYRGLLGSCLKGLAYRGLGLTAAQEGRLADAVEHLRTAGALLPTDPRVRNDLGYVLLLQGVLDEARMNFVTALELGGERRRIGANMVLLLFMAGDEDGAREFAGRMEIDTMELAAIRRQALDLRRGNDRSGQDAGLASGGEARPVAERKVLEQ